MKFYLPNFKNFSKEHRMVFVAGLLIVIALAGSMYLYMTKKANHTALSSALQAGDYLTVIAQSENALARNKNDIETAHILAEAYLSEAVITRSAEWQNKAITFLDAQNKMYPNDATFIRLQGYYYYLKKSYDQAQALYEQVAKIDPNNSSSWSALGQLYEAKSSYNKSADYYKKALALNPSDAIANIGKIRGLFRTHHYEQARQRAKDFLSQKNDSLAMAAALEMLGSDALSQKDFKNAQIYFDQAISRNPNAPVSLASDSFAMFNIVLQGPQTNLTTKLSKPELLALRAVAINPNYSFAYALISRIEALKGNTDKAKKFAALVLSSIKRDDITPPADKTTLKNSFSTSTPGVSNIKIISAKKISAPPKGSSPADSSSTGITIVKKSSK